MTPFDFFDAVQRTQKEFDISRLTLGGVNHWMIIRLLMLSHLGLQAARGTHAMIGASAHSRMIDNPLAQLEKSGLKSARYDMRTLGTSCMLLEPKQRPIVRDTMVFYELPVDYTQVLHGQAVNRIADGFVQAFGDSVRKVCRFELSLFRSQCLVDPAYVLPCPSALNLPHEDCARFLAAVRDFCVYLQEIAPDFAVTASQIASNVSFVLRQSVANEAWLKDLQPQAVAFQCYISMEKMAVLIACKRLGINTIEVQHGYCDRFSIFNEMPASTEKAISIVPDVFWSWGEMTLQALKQDPGYIDNGVKVVLGGDVWGALANQEIAGEVDAFLSRINAPQGARRILIGHQVEALADRDQREFLMPEMLIDAMRNGPKSWLWMIRVHPRSSHMIQPITETLHNLNIRNFEVVNSTMERIEVVLQAADCYVTGFSVSALEANAVGKPVIIIDEVGKRLYEPLIDDHVFTFADNAVDLVSQVKTLKPPSRDAKYYCRDLAASRRVFDSLVMSKKPRANRLASREDTNDREV